MLLLELQERRKLTDDATTPVSLDPQREDLEDALGRAYGGASSDEEV